MPVEWEDVARRIFGEDNYADQEENAEISRVLMVAETLVDDAFRNAWRPVPFDVRDQCVLDVAHLIWKRGDSPSGQQYGDPEGLQPIRQPNDPLSRVRPIINRFVLPL